MPPAVHYGIEKANQEAVVEQCTETESTYVMIKQPCGLMVQAFSSYLGSKVKYIAKEVEKVS